MPVLLPIVSPVPAKMILALDILQAVSFALVEPVVSMNLSGAVIGGTASTVGVTSTVGLYPGALLLINRGGATQEVITVTAVGTNSIVAFFYKSHSIGEAVAGATFPSGQLDHPLFSTAEMLGYLLDVENDFLLKTRCIYSVQADIALLNNTRFYPRPNDAVRIERIALSDGTTELKNTTQQNQDIYDYGWEPESTSDLSSLRWFEDSIGGNRFGISPLSDIGGKVDLWYSQKDVNALGIDSTLLIPDVCVHYIKYGVLALAFKKDGENRDEFRAKYCQARFDLGVKLTSHFMKGIEVLLGDEQEQEIEFQRLAVPAGQ